MQKGIFGRNKNLFMGYILNGTEPVRDNETDFYVTYQQFGGALYDPYMEGTLYILSGDAAISFYEQSLTLYYPPFSDFLDDVYMGMLAKRLNTTLMDISNYCVPKNQYGDLSKERVLRLMNESLFSILFVIADDDPEIFWNELNRQMKSNNSLIF